MTRELIAKLGLSLPLLPTTSVGSFPKPEKLRQLRTRKARSEASAGKLEEEEQEATAYWIRAQEEIGLDVLVDGEQYRGDMVAYFAEQLRGFVQGGLVRSYGNRYYHKPVIHGEIRWEAPITVRWWKFAQGLTSRPVKGMLTGPYTVMDWSFNEHYSDRRQTALALAREIRKEVEALLEAGAKIIQIDEPALSVRPEELPLAIEAMQTVTDGLKAYFITHCCYGAFEFVYPGMIKMPVHNFDLEMTNSDLDLLSLFKKHPFEKDLSFGVADVHSHVVETHDQVRYRIRRALQLLPPEQLWIDPDCGLKTRTEEEAKGKLRAIVEAVREIRAELQA